MGLFAILKDQPILNEQLLYRACISLAASSTHTNPSTRVLAIYTLASVGLHPQRIRMGSFRYLDRLVASECAPGLHLQRNWQYAARTLGSCARHQMRGVPGSTSSPSDHTANCLHEVVGGYGGRRRLGGRANSRPMTPGFQTSANVFSRRDSHLRNSRPYQNSS